MIPSRPAAIRLLRIRLRWPRRPPSPRRARAQQRRARRTRRRAPSKELQVFPNPAPERDYVIQFEIPEFTCLCPLTGQPDFAHFTIDMRRRQAVRRAEEPEDVHVELPQRRRVPREGDQHHPRRHRRRRSSRASSASPPSGTCAAASTPTWSPSTARRAGSRSPRSSCRATVAGTTVLRDDEASRRWLALTGRTGYKRGMSGATRKLTRRMPAMLAGIVLAWLFAMLARGSRVPGRHARVRARLLQPGQGRRCAAAAVRASVRRRHAVCGDRCYQRARG